MVSTWPMILLQLKTNSLKNMMHFPKLWNDWAKIKRTGNSERRKLQLLKKFIKWMTNSNLKSSKLNSACHSTVKHVNQRWCVIWKRKPLNSFKPCKRHIASGLWRLVLHTVQAYSFSIPPLALCYSFYRRLVFFKDRLCCSMPAITPSHLACIIIKQPVPLKGAKAGHFNAALVHAGAMVGRQINRPG